MKRDKWKCRYENNDKWNENEDVKITANEIKKGKGQIKMKMLR